MARCFCSTTLAGILLILFMTVSSATAGETLDAVRSRGRLSCGVSEGIAGFSEKDAAGRWVGFDADFCRALAAAVLGDPEKVEFVPLKASARFPALLAHRIDVLVRNTTWTLGREAGLKVLFPGVMLYDGQGFMVKRKSGVKSVPGLNGATVCVEKGTTSVQNLADYFADRGMRVTPLVFDSGAEVAEAFFTGRCSAYTADATHLAAVRLRAPGGPNVCTILPERISKEPLGPVVLREDDDWFTIVRWVLFALIEAEEAGLTQANVGDSSKPVSRGSAGIWAGHGKSLGVREGWAVRSIQAVGNYGEMFERNLGRNSGLKLERGLNQLWTKGGLMYSPPLR
jgi:general L-amino acid transport system substrate-binding protein